jgi:hypothetical protein
MGRGPLTEPLVPVEVIRQRFGIRQDGALVHRESKRGDLVGEPAGFAVSGHPVVRLQHNGKTRRVGLLRAAWIVIHGAYPLGAVQPRDGDGWNCAPGNLEVVGSGPCRADRSRGGRASSLEHRAEIDRMLLQALTEHEAPSIALLARAIQASETVVSAKLGRLAAGGLAISPMCVPGRSWALTGEGLAAAIGEASVIDQTDRDILGVLIRSPTPMRQVGLARRCGVCSLTIKRRIALLAQRGLVRIVGPQFTLTDAGRQALGPAAKSPLRWIRIEAISAAAAKDVRERSYVSDVTAARRSECGRLARVAAKANRSPPFNVWAEAS